MKSLSEPVREGLKARRNATNVLMLTPHYPPRQGGLADYCSRVANGLQQRGLDVTVLTKDGEATTAPIDVRVFGRKWTPKSIPAMKSIIRDIDPDVVLFQHGGPYSFNRWGPGIPVAVLVSSAARQCNVPLVVYGHELYAPWRQSIIRTPFHLMQRLAILWLIARCAKFVVTIRRRERCLRHWLPWSQSKIARVPISATLEREAADPDWRADNGIEADAFLVAAMGVDDPTKGADVLGAVASRLKILDPAARIVAVGGLRATTPDVEAWGYIDSHDAWNLISAADLFILPFADGVSARRTTALNGLAAGAPLLTTRGTDTDRYLFGPDSMELVEAGDTAGFVNAVLRLRLDPDRLELLGFAGRRLYDREFAWDGHVGRWAEILREIIPK